jgi:hypothetical protein
MGQSSARQQTQQPFQPAETPAEKQTKESLSGKKGQSALGTPAREEEEGKEETELENDLSSGTDNRKAAEDFGDLGDTSTDDDVPRETPPDKLYGNR